LRFGDLAAQLRRRLTQLSAASSLAVLIGAPGRPEALTGNRKGQFSMRVSANQRLIFEVADQPLPLKAAGGIDLTLVRAIRILEVTDYHAR
jgi:plasmid maintenance system killer protein